MALFLSFHNTLGQMVYMNPEAVAAVFPSGTGSQIQLVGGGYHTVTEAPAVVIQSLSATAQIMVGLMQGSTGP